MKILFTLHSTGGSMVEATNVLWGAVVEVTNPRDIANIHHKLSSKFAGELILSCLELDSFFEPVTTETAEANLEKFIDKQGYAKDEDEITRGWIENVKPSEETIKMFAYPYWVKHYQKKTS